MKRTFEIAATSAAFDILANKLYSNPRLAVLRELCTNANDAHIMANNLDRNFVLHIPTADSPFFSIRDFGPGLTVDEFELIYFNFFVSTKQGDDSQTGNFGLGAKSPFACANSFKVSSYQKGKRVTYQLEPEDGVPTYEIVEEAETLEPDGLEIFIDDWKDEYKRDMYLWKKIAMNFFKSTSFLPNANFTDDEYNELLRVRPFYQKNSIMFDIVNYPTITCNVAGVGFKVEPNEIGADELISLLNSLCVSDINIMAAKNDVSITPSREELQYDAKTQMFITDAIKQTIASFDASAHDVEEIRFLANRLYNSASTNTLLKNFPLTCAEIKAEFNKISGYGFYTLMIFDKKNKWFEYTPYNSSVCQLLGERLYESKIFIVDTNGITKTLEKSLDVVKKDHFKYPVLISYYSGYGHQNQLSKFRMIPSANPVETQKAFEKLTGYKAQIIRLADLTRWQPAAIANSPKDAASRKRLGWITSGALTSYKGKKSRGIPDFDLTGVKVAYIACEYGASDKLDTVSELQKFTEDDTFVVIRQGSLEWVAKQREAGIELTSYSDYERALVEKAKPKFKDAALKYDLNTALGICHFPTDLMIALSNDPRLSEKEYFKTWKEMKEKAESLPYVSYEIRRLANDFRTTENTDAFEALQNKFLEDNPVVKIIDTYQAKKYPDLFIALLK